jgi:hypothetical protein
VTLFLILLSFLLALALTGAIVFLLVREGENRSRIAGLTAQVQEEIERNTNIKRFEHIPGVIEKSKRVSEEIAAKLQAATNEAELIHERARLSCQILLNRSRNEATLVQNRANQDSKQIIAAAEKEADQIREVAEKEADELRKLYELAIDEARLTQERAKKNAELIREAAEYEAGELRARQLVELAKEDALLIKRDAEGEAALIRDRAESEAGELRARQLVERAREDAKQIETAAEKEINELRAKARLEVKEKVTKAEDALSGATVEAHEIIVRAEKKAVEIGGKAYEALKKLEFYERAADAMNNVIKGYGNRYMVPAESILDVWVEEYGFHVVGEKLRLARERVRIMEKNRTAASCEYVEAGRREMAINFVVDAFNGKVDSILSRVKKDNFGKLRKEIEDAFALVNFNGKPFRDAKVSEEYLDARIDELKYAAEMQRLRERDREEQRQIREKIREEEKARREYDRAIKQAQRDEDLLKKAMEEIQKKFNDATLEERQKYEERLHDLSIKLTEAEERNQRAISMAQQTKQGHVYIISNVGSFGENVYKIGLTRRLEPLDRVRELGDASVPFPFDVHAMIQSEDAPALEHSLHKLFLQNQVNKVNSRKEFFRLSIADIKKSVDELKADVRWTLTAEARDYRETLALEDALKNDPNYRQRWVDRQLELEMETENEDELIGEEDLHELAVADEQE